MAGILKVDKYQDFNGNDIMTSDGSGNITMPNGIISGQNYPAFEAYLSADQTGLSDNTYVKCQLDTEVFDTDNCYDNSTNYRFTPNVAGKYYVYGGVMAKSETGNDTVWCYGSIYKNGTVYRNVRLRPDGANDANDLFVFVSAIIDMNGTTDYVELFGNVNTTANGTWEFEVTNGTKPNYFGAYRIGA